MVSSYKALLADLDIISLVVLIITYVKEYFHFLKGNIIRKRASPAGGLGLYAEYDNVSIAYHFDRKLRNVCCNELLFDFCRFKS